MSAAAISYEPQLSRFYNSRSAGSPGEPSDLGSRMQSPHLKRSRPAHDSECSATRTRAKRRLIDSFTRLSLESGSEAASPVPSKKRHEEILHYDYWDRSKPARPEDDNDDDGRMDTSNAHTIFISSLDSTSDEEEEEAKESQDKIVFVPDLERKIMDLPYSLLRRRDEAAHSSIPAMISLHEQERGMVLYKSKEAIIAESIARHVGYRKSNNRKKRVNAQDYDSMIYEDNCGDDEREPNDTNDEDLDLRDREDDEDAMDLD
ncbi:hypothetical protein V1520DRAFT_390644 [Lipomyces starkeyi]|uniref:Uncharacterized protein n=1 Tax=Lipomyces starkeyi NRRL Y-11557 TaxID=675824 RepID=A0A1E3QCY5_LIPST|nr:hypothetical protein LIPSTDRAFT_982 [Lipomyces starkeyi NRRL Y-11557]